MIRVRLFELGHTFEYIDEQMGLLDVGDVLGYWSGKGKAEEKLRKKAERKSRRGGKRG